MESAIANETTLIAEAPCGIGKSMAYLVPAIRHAVRTKTRVVIVTGKIILQEQLIDKDLPMLAKHLPWPFKYALLKGRSHYLCESRMGEAFKNNKFGNNPSVQTKSQLDRVVEWGKETRRGDESELDFKPTVGVWAPVCGNTDECSAVKINPLAIFS